MYETHDKRALLLPNVTSADAGKVLAVDENGKLSLEEIASELPTLTGNAGKVLTVASGASGVEWKVVPSELPSLTGNAGKFLKVDSDAEGVEWSEAGGGNGLYIMPFVVDGSNVSISGSAVRYMAQNHPPIVAAIDPQDSNQYVTVGLASFGTDFANYGSSDYKVAINGFWWGIQFTYDSATDTYYYHPEN